MVIESKCMLKRLLRSIKNTNQNKLKIIFQFYEDNTMIKNNILKNQNYFLDCLF